MNTDTEKKTEKEAYKYLRAKVCSNVGGLQQRYLLLAYAFVRGIPYVALERVINEDKFPASGRDTFYRGLIFAVAKNVRTAYGLDNNCTYESPEHKEVYAWVMEKFAKAEEVAA